MACGIALAALALAGRVEAQDDAAPSDDPLRVYLVTMSPGLEVWNRFGHNAIWIHDDRTGQDLVWNWGLFAFDQVGFIPRLVRGEMLYSMGGFTLRQTIAQYEAEGRDVWAQELALTPAQEAELDRFVRRNAQPANRDYLYDYYLDNCSTRVRDALDLVLGGAIERHFSDLDSGTTWRWHTRRLLRHVPWAYAGVALVLGHPGDRAISAYEEMFLPMRLRTHLAGLFVEQRDGSMRPLVVGETRLVDGELPPPPDAPPSPWPVYLAFGVGIGGLMAGAGLAGSKGGVGRVVAALPVALWSVAGGLAGTVLLGSLLTDHTFWYPNENLLQANPLSWAVAVLALGAVFRPRLVKPAARAARWIAVLSVAGLAVKILPWFDQGNAEILALAVPINLAAAWALHRWRDDAAAAGEGAPRPA